MDTIEVRMPSELHVQWPGGGGFQQVEILINNEPLVDIFRSLELPHVRREYDQRIADGESLEKVSDFENLAGQYLYLSPDTTFPPSENFFGEPYSHGFLTEANDPVNKKSLILQCTCGITDCWFLLADITVCDDTVIWDNFQQFHRDWEYDINPFVFNRVDYVTAFNNTTKVL